MQRLGRILDRSFAEVIARAEGRGVSNRVAAMSVGVEKVRNVKATRGLFP